ncbi:hypothetical protein N8Z09_03950, partial [Methylophilaceae bacterium]|nr:hypothetical protein [Methylophilaceae bacterium]
MKYHGKAIFCDCDFLWTRDIKELYDQIQNKSVYVVPHEDYGYMPKTKTKMDGQHQTVYPRKNWSSMMAFNCDSLDCQRLSLDAVNQQPLSYLHRFEWVNDDKKIGYLKPTWNWLSGYYSEKDWGKPGAVHYTDGGPWFNDNNIPEEMGIESWSNVQYGQLWNQYLKEYQINSKLPEKHSRTETNQLTFGPKMKTLFVDLQMLLLDGYNLQNEKLVDKIIDQIKKQQTTQGILGISDMEDLSQTLKDKGYKWDKVVEYFCQGAGGTLTDWKTVYEGQAKK